MDKKCPQCGKEYTPVPDLKLKCLQCIDCGLMNIEGQNQKVVDAVGCFIDAMNCLCEAGDYSAKDVMDVFSLACDKDQDIGYARIGLGMMLGCLDVLFPDEKGITEQVRKHSRDTITKYFYKK